ncbi:MAG: type II toxin-antitoxin system prevent-host-death family antitoxin [Actinobacteria bacterium]|nr:type II toxin-antitoxin system prevent-host-death family antitoxin [Actinomycetota bacterium]
MPRELTQRELRNNSGEIMRALDRGDSFVVTRRGVPVAELRPLARRRSVDTRALLDAFAHQPALDRGRFRADLDAVVDQDPTPRA